LFAVVFSQPIIGFIEQGFDRFRLEREGADDRDRKVVAASRSHFAARIGRVSDRDSSRFVIRKLSEEKANHRAAIAAQRRSSADVGIASS
jgi:hypothetical protein